MAKRISLREYQEGVVAKLKALAGSHSIASKLGIQIGNGNWLVDLADVSEVMPVPAVVALPLTQRWFKGVANIRGNLYSVVDLPQFMGGDAVQTNMMSRLLLINQRHIMNSAMLVNRMLGLKNIDNMSLVGPAEATLPWQGAAYQDETGQVWRELNLSLLVQQPGYVQVGAV